ncbi:MAG: cation:proton antiporter domain-containing protein [Myxococcales bacterium]
MNLSLEPDLLRPEALGGRRAWARLGGYVLLVGGATAAVAMVLHLGRAGRAARVGAAAARGPLGQLAAAAHSPVSQLLLQLLLVVIAARLAGMLAQRLAQPPVVGEMAAGLALGPSLLGWIAPSVSRFVFPDSSLSSLFILSQIGILLFMFGVGLELDGALLRKRAESAILISHASILVPFTLGTAEALWLFRGYAGPAASFEAFALFLGISMSITAFPVLARILRERALTGTPLGSTALTCAAVDDVTAWCGLAFIVTLCRAEGSGAAWVPAILTVVFVAAVLGVLRPLLRWALPSGEPSRGVAVAALATAFGCALATEAIGIHALFGAFLAGVAMPADPGFRRVLRERIEWFSTLFLLPIFFVFTGLRTDISQLGGLSAWGVCASLVIVAVAGKVGGSALAARLTGSTWREAAGLGVLMNTRGLVELVALNLGLDLGVLSSRLFAMLVLMALLTTLSTAPALSLLGLGDGGRVDHGQ